MAALSAYNFSLSYRPGKHNADADGLSRRPHPSSADKTQPADSLPADVSSDVIKALYSHHLEDEETNHHPPIEAVCCNPQVVPASLDTPAPWPSQPTLPGITMMEWRVLQEADPAIKGIIDLKCSGQ